MADLGRLVLVLGWALGLVAVGLSVQAWANGPRSGSGQRWRAPSMGRTGVLAGCGALVLSLFAPWIAGPAAGTGERLVLTGWEGLDVLSVAGLVVLAGAIALHALLLPGSATDARLLGAALGGAALGVVAGNVLIQLDQPGGSRVAWGAVVSLAVAVLTLVDLVRLDRGDGPATEA